ncbi:unnamed protein product [Mytilus edulis]|uniref:Uncharacterized protein n=1 Tax=Mytilus edulis TaxID=6550 RepID=A0A8S3TQ67_MYTED|nr:unnamed protein product [Mytilus edulis]
MDPDLSFWRSPEMEKKSFLTDLETKNVVLQQSAMGNFFVNIYDNRPNFNGRLSLAFEEAVQFSELVSQLEMPKENFKVENKTTSNPTAASGSTTFNPEPFVSPTYKPELYIPSSRGSAEIPPPPPYKAPKKKKKKKADDAYPETFRSPSEVGNININPSIIVGWIITSKVISDIEENSYITALVEFGTSIISEFSYCRQHPDYKEHMVIQLLNILSVMFRFMSIHRRWGPADFRMERIVDKLAMKEELSDIIKFSINNDWDLQGHDTNLKPSRIKKNVNHLATGLPDHHYQL